MGTRFKGGREDRTNVHIVFSKDSLIQTVGHSAGKHIVPETVLELKENIRNLNKLRMKDTYFRKPAN